MNQQRYTRIFFYLLLLGITVPLTNACADVDESATLSPYFLITDEESHSADFFLQSTAVEATISGVIANVTVHQIYANTGNVPIHGQYVFPGSTRAAIHGMTMTIGEKHIKAEIKEKEQAQNIFNRAKAQGKTASLLVQHRPNVFTMNVANIMPGDKLDIELHYTELLQPRNNIYTFVYPTVVGPRYSTQKETTKEQTTANGDGWISNPYLQEGRLPNTSFSIAVHMKSGLPINGIACTSHQITTHYRNPNELDVQLTPSAEFAGNRDFILNYRLQGQKIESGLLMHQGNKGNYFLLMIQPPAHITPEIIPDRDYLFIIDVSGSMEGFPLDTAKKLIHDLLTGLRSTDTFNVLLFAGSSKLLAPASLPASNANITQAIDLVNREKGGGGTNLLPALQRALAMPKDEQRSRSIVIITDGYIGEEQDIFHTIQNNLINSNIFTFGIGSSVNRYLIEGMAKAGQGEPFIITDPAQSGQAAADFLSYIKAPVLTDISINTTGTDLYDLEPEQQPDMFSQRPLLLFGKFHEKKGHIEITGKKGDGSLYHTSYALTQATETDAGLEYLWARTRIDRLADYSDNHANLEKKEAITQLGLSYNLLTAYTSFVAVDERIRNSTGKAKDVKQPLPLPKGVANSAVAATSMHRVPEPAFFLLIPLLYLVLRLIEKDPSHAQKRRNK